VPVRAIRRRQSLSALQLLDDCIEFFEIITALVRAFHVLSECSRFDEGPHTLFFVDFADLAKMSASISSVAMCFLSFARLSGFSNSSIARRV
jgi:hypothetical protein